MERGVSLIIMVFSCSTKEIQDRERTGTPASTSTSGIVARPSERGERATGKSVNTPLRNTTPINKAPLLHCTLYSAITAPTQPPTLYNVCIVISGGGGGRREARHPKGRYSRVGRAGNRNTTRHSHHHREG